MCLRTEHRNEARPRIGGVVEAEHVFAIVAELKCPRGLFGHPAPTAWARPTLIRRSLEAARVAYKETCRGANQL
jgi:hypothetical protein